MAMSTEKGYDFQVFRLKYGDDESQFGDLYVPEAAGLHSVALLLHGGFWSAQYGSDQFIGMAENLVRQGIAVWNIEYRRVGNPNGGWPTTLQDVEQATDYLTTIHSTYALDLQRSVIVGHSAGGELALLVAAHWRHQDTATQPSHPHILLRAVVCLAGVVDMEQAWQLPDGKDVITAFMGGCPASQPENYASASPISQLPIGVHQILLLAAHDQYLPRKVSQDYTAKAIAAGDKVTLIEIPDADHFALIDPDSAGWARAVQEIKKHLAI